MSERESESALDPSGASAWVASFCARFAESVDELTALDRRAGDGDFGDNVNAPLQRVASTLASWSASTETAGAAFALLSTELMRAGGTSGPLFGALFRSIAKQGSQPQMSLAELAAGVADGTAAVARLGGASPGDSTMLDALVPAVTALQAASARGERLAAALADAAVAARGGADATAAMVARRGRASYVGDSGLGVVDPGAAAVALLFESAGYPTAS